MKILSSIGSLIDRFCVVGGAFVGSQVPEFMHQYMHRLSGHVNELQHLLNQMRQIASYSNKTLEQYIDKFVSSADIDFIRQGEFMQGIYTRWEELNQAIVHLQQASMWTRPYVFFKELQVDIAQSTLKSFQPGINLTLEGLCYSGLGVLIGLAFYQIVSKSIQIGCTRVVAILKQGI